MKNNESIVLAAVTQCGHALAFASLELKNSETVVLAAIDQNGLALQYASKEMKNSETVVLAAVYQNGLALQYASAEMKNSETVVLDAVSQNGEALEYASAGIKNNERIALTAIAKGASEDLVPMDLMTSIREAARAHRLTPEAYADARLHAQIVQIFVFSQSSGQGLTITCHKLNGDQLATLTLQTEMHGEIIDLRGLIAAALQPPRGPASLRIVLPTGHFLGDIDSQVPLQRLVS